MEDATESPRNVTPTNPAASPGYAALRGSAAVVDRPAAVMRLSGKDPRGMLNAILSSDVPEEENAGAYALLLDPKGRIQTDLRVVKLPSGGDLLVVAEPEGADAAKEILGRYAPFSRVQLEELRDWRILGLYGPDVAAMRDAAFGLAEHESAEIENGGLKVLTVGVATPIPGIDHLGPGDTVRALRERLISSGAVPADPADYETVRIEARVPRFGQDLTPDNFPGESGVLERAVDFGKGCYPGQETVARMHYRGSPNKTLRGFVAEGTPPEPGEEILQGEKRVGRITSVSPLRPNGETLALGYLSRSADAEGQLRAANASLTPR